MLNPERKNPLLAQVRTAGPWPVQSRYIGRLKNRESVRRDRVKLRQFINQRNCQWIMDALPLAPYASLHCITPGNFLFGDLILKMAELFKPTLCRLTTLSLSRKNVDQLLTIAAAGCELKIIVSGYWISTDKEKAHQYLAQQTTISARQLRSHTKTVVFVGPGAAYVLTGSSNLRSSGSIEQFDIHHDPELSAWYIDAFDEGWTAGTELPAPPPPPAEAAK